MGNTGSTFTVAEDAVVSVTNDPSGLTDIVVEKTTFQTSTGPMECEARGTLVIHLGSNKLTVTAYYCAKIARNILSSADLNKDGFTKRRVEIPDDGLYLRSGSKMVPIALKNGSFDARIEATELYMQCVGLQDPVFGLRRTFCVNDTKITTLT